jgi:hypothetical protein
MVSDAQSYDAPTKSAFCTRLTPPISRDHDVIVGPEAPTGGVRITVLVA